jgi:WD40 repeat protein
LQVPEPPAAGPSRLAELSSAEKERPTPKASKPDFIEPEYDPSDDEEGGVDSDSPQFPVTHEITLKQHTKVVSALALDPSGARILSGSHDYDCKLWDFGGMDSRCMPFKSWEPSETHHVRSIHACHFILSLRLTFWHRFTM